MFRCIENMREYWSRARFEQILKRSLPDLYRMSRALTANAVDAEDLVHEICVKAIGAFDRVKFTGKADVKVWVRRILVNTFRDYYRREMRAPVSHTYLVRKDGEMENVIELAACNLPDPSLEIAATRFSDAAKAAIRALPPEVRLVVTLFLISDLTYKEIVEATDSPMGMVMSRLSRGRQQLRSALQSYVSVPGIKGLDESKVDVDLNIPTNRKRKP